MWLAIFFKVAFQGQPHAAKRLARIADRSPRTTEAWVTGRRAPDLDALILLMAELPDLQDKINDDVELLRRARAASRRARVTLDDETDRVGSILARPCIAETGDRGRGDGQPYLHRGCDA